MRYFEMFTGIAGFSKGIEQAYGHGNKYESTQPEPPNGGSGRKRVTNGGRADVLSANHSALCDGGGARMPECIGFSEIGKTANAILRYLYPNVCNYGDAAGIVCNELPDFDLLVGGFPCQAFSIAGKRKGFADTRGTLFFEIARILEAKRPRHFLLENVAGLLSHDDGQTFRTIIATLDEIGYDLEWTVINSKHHGVPQNRERVFIIGHPRGGSCGEILSFGDSDEDIDGTCGQRNDIAHTITNDDKARGSYVVASTEIYGKDGKRKPTSIAATLTGGGHSGGNHSDMDLITVGTLRTHKDGEGFREMRSNVSPSLNARARQDDGSQQPVIAIPVLTPDRPTKRQNGRRMKEDGEASFTITAADRHGVMVAVNDERAGNRVYEADGIAATVTANVTGGTKNERYKVENRIRRLTPTECARLQGFADDHADYGMFQDKNGEWQVKEISDTGKYQCFGNAVTVNVIEAIVTRMIEKGCLG